MDLNVLHGNRLATVNMAKMSVVGQQLALIKLRRLHPIMCNICQFGFKVLSFNMAVPAKQPVKYQTGSPSHKSSSLKIMSRFNKSLDKLIRT